MGRLTGTYHSLFRLAQTTMHDRWVKWLRLIAFVAASSIATQIVLRTFLGSIGLEGLLPSSVLVFLVASAVWLLAYPAMRARMIMVMTNMKASKEYETVLREVEKLHHRRGPEVASPPERGPP